MNRRVLLILVAMNAIWAGTYTATKVLMAHAPFFAITSVRYLIAAVPLLLVAHLRHGLSMPRRDLLRCGAMGVSTFTLCPVLLYAGVGLSRSSDAAILTATEPLLISLGVYLYLRERIGTRTGAAVALAFCGAITLSGFWREDGSVNPVGSALILAGVFFEAMYSVIGKELLRRHPPLRLTAAAIAASSVVNIVALTALDLWPSAGALRPGDWALLVGYLSLICTFVGYTVWYAALRRETAARVTLTIFTQPVVGILVGWAWVGEVPGLPQIAGTALILTALTIAVLGPSEVPTQKG